MGLLSKIANFYSISKPAPLSDDVGTAKGDKRYRRLAFESFVAATVGYSLYYVCRTSLNVMKKPIIDSGFLDAAELGVIGSALLFAYAIGKAVNGFVCDYCNIKRFMATGLTLSLAVNFIMGMLGFVDSVVPTAVIFGIFIVLWAINGWAQSMGSPPAIISLSRWFPLSRRGTFYGIFSASHNLGEFFSFLFVGNVVLAAGWQWGFVGSAVAGALGVILVLFLLHDHPQAKGLPAIETIAHEKSQDSTLTTSQIQRQVLQTPAVWVLAGASAFMYISRYAINGWGILFLEEVKGFDSKTAVWIVSINALLGIFGTVLSGWFSDSLFKGDRRVPALIFGIMNSVALVLFVFGGNALWVNVLAMSLFGVAMGVLICFLGGLMAVDIVPRRATGAALGIVGVASYIAAGLQDVISGWLIDRGVTIVEDGSRVYDFTGATIFWIAASVISFLLPLLNWKYGKKDRED
jgi:OPA family sugar phosphate sensor protein UhpC-like MFS transporter